MSDSVATENLVEAVKQTIVTDLEAARDKQIEQKFQEYLASGQLVVDPEDPGKYVIARFTCDKRDAVQLVQDFAKLANFDRFMQHSFCNGMLDVLGKVRGEIVRLNQPLKMEPAIKICDRLATIIKTRMPK